MWNCGKLAEQIVEQGFLSLYLRGQREQEQNIHLVIKIPRGAGGRDGDHNKTCCSWLLNQATSQHMPVLSSEENSRAGEVWAVLLKSILVYKRVQYSKAAVLSCPFNTWLSVSGRYLEKFIFELKVFNYGWTNRPLTLHARVTTEGDARHTTDWQKDQLSVRPARFILNVCVHCEIEN